MLSITAVKRALKTHLNDFKRTGCVLQAGRKIIAASIKVRCMFDGAVCHMTEKLSSMLFYHRLLNAFY